jgi:RNA-directed DNA polymerase
MLWTDETLVPTQNDFMQQMVERGNLLRACHRVVSNGGSPGVDGMNTRELPGWLQGNLDELIESLQNGTYKPSPVRLVEIEKPGGGKRGLGVPTVVDRMIQQAIHQVLNPIFDPGFSDHSYGFRLRRDAGQAVLKAREYQQNGKRWVVNVDLSKFFDEVNHDVLMSLLKRKVKDSKLLKLIDLYLKAGIMQGGLTNPRRKGTPQGGLCEALHKPPCGVP